MQKWRFPRALCRLTILLAIASSLALLGCDDDGLDLGSFRDATVQDVENTSLLFDATFLDPSFAGQDVTLVFGAAAADTVPFEMRFSGSPNTVIAGIFDPPPLRVDEILVDAAQVDSTRVGNVVFEVGTVAFELEVEIRDDEDFIELRLTNLQTGAQILLQNFD